MLNLKTMEQEIAAVKQWGERDFIPKDMDCDNYTYTNDLRYPINDEHAKAEFMESKQTLYGLYEERKNDTKWTCTFQNCGKSYNSAGSFRNHRLNKSKIDEDHHHTSSPDKKLVVKIKDARKRMQKTR